MLGVESREVSDIQCQAYEGSHKDTQQLGSQLSRAEIPQAEHWQNVKLLASFCYRKTRDTSEQNQKNREGPELQLIWVQV